MDDLDLTMSNTEKLVLTLEDKEKYVTHYKNLQLYLSLGMRLKKVHRVTEFDQEPWDGAIHQDEHGVSKTGEK